DSMGVARAGIAPIQGDESTPLYLVLIALEYKAEGVIALWCGCPWRDPHVGGGEFNYHLVRSEVHKPHSKTVSKAVSGDPLHQREGGQSPLTLTGRAVFDDLKEIIEKARLDVLLKALNVDAFEHIYKSKRTCEL